MIDLKADSIKNFDLLSNFMWRRAEYLLSQKKQGMEVVEVLDPCAGGGKLINKANPSYEITAYESDYRSYKHLTARLAKLPHAGIVTHNASFELHFTDPYLPVFDLVIGIPCIDRPISKLEKDPDYLKIKNYAFYVMIRAMDIMEEGGFGVFAIPKKLMDREEYLYEVMMIAERGILLSAEGYEDYAIILLQKTKA